MPANACLMVTSSTSLTVSFQEPLSVNAAVVTRYKGTALSLFSLCSFLERYGGVGVDCVLRVFGFTLVGLFLSPFVPEVEI